MPVGEARHARGAVYFLLAAVSIDAHSVTIVVTT